MNRLLPIALLLLSARALRAAPPAPPPPAVVPSTAAAQVTVDDLYPAARLRDPFQPVEGQSGRAAASAAVVVPPEEFSIHDLQLKGVMEDRTGGFAVLTDAKYGAAFMLKRGRLYNAKNKPVPGVTGSVKVKQKMVHLMTRDRDVQVLILGEQDEDKDKP